MSKQILAPTKPEECPHFGQELPAGWRCPPCPLAEACFEAYENPAVVAIPGWAPLSKTHAVHTTTSTTSRSRLPEM